MTCNSKDLRRNVFSIGDKPILGLIVFLTALFPRVLNLGVFFAPDERYIWQTSNEFAMALARGNLGGTAITAYPGVTLMWIETLAAFAQHLWNTLTAPGSVPWTATLGMDLPLEMLAEKRLALALVHIALIIIMWHWLDELFGRWVAFLGGLLIALDPFLLAESRVVRMEVLTSEFMSLSIVGLLVYFDQKRRRFLLASGAFAGLAILTKISSVFLLPFVGFVLAVYVGAQRGQPLRATVWQILQTYVQWLVAVIVIFVGLWPALWVEPGATWQLLWEYVSRVGGQGFQGRGVFFRGQVHPDDPGLGFYPVALAFRIGPLVLPGIIGFLLFLLEGLRTRSWDSGKVGSGNLVVNLGGLTAFAAGYVAFLSLGALKYDRYLLPIFPALDVLAGFGLWYVLVYLLRLTRAKNQVALAVGVLSLLLIVQGAISWSNHPYYYTYYNPLLGGIQQAQELVWVGNGEGLDQVAAYLNAKPNADKIRLASAMSSKIGPLLDGDTIPINNLDGRWVQADYVFVYISQLQRGKHDPEILTYLARQEPEFVLRLHGVEYGKLYPGPAAQHYSGTKLEGRGTLYGYDLSATQLRAGDVLTATLYWRNEGQEADDAFFVEVMDAADYPWASALAQPRPGFEQAARTRKAVLESKATLSLPMGMPRGHYFLKMGFVTDNGQTLVGRFQLPPDGDDILVALPDSFPGSDAVPVAHGTNFATDDLSLLGYDLSPTTIRAGDKGWLTLFWRAKQDAPRDYVVGIRLLADAREITYWLGRPVYSGYATSEWSAGQVVQDPWELSLPEEVSPGDYQLELVLFDSMTGETLAHTLLGSWSVIAP